MTCQHTAPFVLFAFASLDIVDIVLIHLDSGLPVVDQYGCLCCSHEAKSKSTLPQSCKSLASVATADAGASDAGQSEALESP